MSDLFAWAGVGVMALFIARICFEDFSSPYDYGDWNVHH